MPLFKVLVINRYYHYMLIDQTNVVSLFLFHINIKLTRPLIINDIKTNKPKKSKQNRNTKKKPNRPMNRDDADQQSPSSPQVYRRQISREDAPAADVFARLGAGVQDPIPGGLIREYSGKVRNTLALNRFFRTKINF